jgi:hypothetical protein
MAWDNNKNGRIDKGLNLMNETVFTSLRKILHTYRKKHPDREDMSLGELFDAMEERAFGLLLLLLALPCCLPFVYLLPQIVALPMLLLTSQLALGRHTPYLPHKIRARRMSLSGLEDVINRADKMFGWMARLAGERLRLLSQPYATRIIGALLMIPCASILVPLPSTNTVPGIGVTLAAIGLIERDGWLILAGLIVGLFWVGLLVIGGPMLLVWLMGWGEGA